MSRTRAEAARGEPDGRSPFAGFERSDAVWGLVLVAVIASLLAFKFGLGGGRIPELPLGPVRLSAFGLLAALDLLFALYLVKRWCDRFGLDFDALVTGLPWIVLGGYYISHLVSVAFYYPQDLDRLAVLLDPRTRISSLGGMFGGGLIAVAFLRRRGMPVWRYADPLTLGFVGGYVFGRAGCFAIHDHPGRASDFPLAVVIDGVRRHDLGFYEMWLMLALLLTIWLIARQRRPPDGFVLSLVATLYAPIRFLLDFLRVGDARYGGLTPAQWLVLPLLAIGLWGFARLVARRRLSG